MTVKEPECSCPVKPAPLRHLAALRPAMADERHVGEGMEAPSTVVQEDSAPAQRCRTTGEPSDLGDNVLNVRRKPIP